MAAMNVVHVLQYKVSMEQATGRPIRPFPTAGSLQPDWLSDRSEVELWRLVFPAKGKEAHLLFHLHNVFS